MSDETRAAEASHVSRWTPLRLGLLLLVLVGVVQVFVVVLVSVLGTGAINQDTGAGFVDTNNYQAVKALADAGLR